MIERSSIFHLHPALAIEDFETGSLALNVETLQMVELNHTAREMTRYLEQGHSMEDIAAAMAEAYAQPIETVLEDVSAVIEQLLALGIIRPGVADETKDQGE
ncbi:MAG: PqqD family protein [Anaerolineae bacterium]|nr:PqqD family protein [Anaerolineae bacterium]